MKNLIKFKSKSIKVITFLLSILFAGALQAQDSKDSTKPVSKVISVGYGIKYLGYLEVDDRELAIGLHYLKSKKHSFNFILSGHAIETEYYYSGNPDWYIDQHSKGIDLSADYGYMMNMDNMVFYPSGGVVFRYSQERLVGNHGYSRDVITGEYDWYCEMNEYNGFKVGYVLGLNLEYIVSNNFSFGFKGYLKEYFLGPQMRVLYIGVIVKSGRLSF